MAKTIATIIGSFNFDRTLRLRRQLEYAKKRDPFGRLTFEGELLEIMFAETLLAYLETHFNLDEEDEEQEIENE